MYNPSTKKPLFVWFVLTAIIAAFSFWLQQYGIFIEIYNADLSHITQLIAAICIFGNFRIGWLAYKWSKYTNFNHIQSNILARYRKHIDEWWFLSDQFMALGIIGTVIGFIFLFHIGFSGLDGLSSSQIVEKLPTIIPRIIAPLGTVFYTTAAGLVAALIVKLQLLLFTSFSGIEDSKYET